MNIQGTTGNVCQVNSELMAIGHSQNTKSICVESMTRNEQQHCYDLTEVQNYSQRQTFCQGCTRSGLNEPFHEVSTARSQPGHSVHSDSQKPTENV